MRRRKRGRRVVRCPHCQSDRLVFEGGMILGQLYHCLSCGYVGPFVIETDEPIDPHASGEGEPSD